jgi:hypothetical protein
MKQTQPKSTIDPLRGLSNEGRRTVYRILAKAFAERRGHGGAGFVVHRQLRREQLAEMLGEAVRQTEGRRAR